jgi:hypothetical protein
MTRILRGAMPALAVCATVMLTACTGAGLAGATSGTTPTAPATAPAGKTSPPATTSPSRPGHLPNDVPIEAGDYSYRGVPPLLVTFTVAADGWESWGAGVVKGGATTRRMAGVGFADIADLHADPCRWKSGRLEPTLGPTVDDLVVALVALPHFDVINAPAETVVDGFAGKYLALRIAEDVVLADCDDGTFNSYIWTDGTGRYHQGPGQVEEFWIVDVEGTRLVINAASFPETDARHLAERDAIIASIRVEPPE